MRTLKLVLERFASKSRSANQKPPDGCGKPTVTGNTHGSLEKPMPPVADNEIGPRFELLKIARCHWLSTPSP